jgi:DNA-3-methyladenine glycosylase
MRKKILPASFYNRPTLVVARELLGAQLVREIEGIRVSGFIIETEAYIGEDDLGCHAKAGRTPRTETMYGPPGRAYVYFTYGMHWLLNAVTEKEGFPAAVLIRALHPVEGVDFIAARRASQPRAHWTDGPAKLTRALAIDGSFNNVNLCSQDSGLWIEEGVFISDENVTRAPRVGLYSVPEPWKSIPWRFLARLPKKEA